MDDRFFRMSRPCPRKRCSLRTAWSSAPSILSTRAPSSPSPSGAALDPAVAGARVAALSRAGMTLRLPGKPSSDLWRKSPASTLNYEIAQETASTLGQHNRALEAALKELADHNAADPPHPSSERAALVATAAHAFWQFIVQREACGLHDASIVVRMYRVPAEV